MRQLDCASAEVHRDITEGKISSVSELCLQLFFFFHTIMIYIQLVAEKTASLLCLPVLQEKEGWEMLRGWVRVKVSIPARPELSRGRAVAEHGWRCGCCGGSSAGA